jgi:hypothetical protein
VTRVAYVGIYLEMTMIQARSTSVTVAYHQGTWLGDHTGMIHIKIRPSYVYVQLCAMQQYAAWLRRCACPSYGVLWNFIQSAHLWRLEYFYINIIVTIARSNPDYGTRPIFLFIAINTQILEPKNREKQFAGFCEFRALTENALQKRKSILIPSARYLNYI